MSGQRISSSDVCARVVCLLLLLCGALLCGALSGGRTQERNTERLHNGGFEQGASDGKGAGALDWAAFESGYTLDPREAHGGDRSLRCDSPNASGLFGAQQRVLLNQTRPTPIRVTGWSRADQVQGEKDSDYALYIDLEYTDGTPLWGQTASFSVGTHAWERRQILILPAKPIKTMTVFALFRHHAGTVWFDDFSARELEGPGLFDSQPMDLPPHRTPPPRGAPPNLHIAGKDGLSLSLTAQGEINGVRAGAQDVSSATSGGFYVRDVAINGPLSPLRGQVAGYGTSGVLVTARSEAAHVKLLTRIGPQGDAVSVDGELADLTKTDRAVTVYLVLPVHAEGWQWGQDIRRAEPVAAGREYSNQTSVHLGATGGLSLYPFGCLSNGASGIGIANQMDWPSVYRIFYNAEAHCLVMAWDFALTAKTAAWPAKCRFRCTLFCLSPHQAAWGFRGATQRFYALNAAAFARRAKTDGLWIPFADPSKVARPGDFGFAYHEGDNSVKTDNALGILSFRYTEPSSTWLPMPPDLPRTYEAALQLLKATASPPSHTTAHSEQNGEKSGEKSRAQAEARAVLNSGAQDENGRFLLQFRNTPWTNGAVFLLNPNPELSATPDQPTKASLSYTFALATQRYGAAARREHGELSGEYLDSLEAWTDAQDYRPSHLLSCPYPVPFDSDTHRPVLPQWYSVHTFARFLRDDLHNRGKLLMANSTPIRFSIFAALCDVMGIEVNWLDGQGHWRPDSDAVFNLRRTLSAHKPYLLLMNTDFDKFTPEWVERYFQRSLFYGVFPSMFSANAADHNYWETPKWIERDRPLFVKYLPVIKKLSAAGWEPLTYARSANPVLYVERFGARHFTLLNDSPRPADTTVTIDLRALNLHTVPTLHVINLLTGAEVPARRNGATLALTLHLNAEEAQALELK